MIVVVLLVLVIALVLFATFIPSDDRGDLSEWASTPLISSAIILAVGFLLFERWRRLEDEVSKLREDQFEAVERIRGSAQDLVKGDIERSTLRADGLEARISNLEEEHPWIRDLTEHEFIADAWTARVVLMTAEYLVETGRIPIAYEYIWHVLHPTDERRVLNGTAAEFAQLADYCSQTLGDDYLSLGVLRLAIARRGFIEKFGPSYLQRIAFNGEDPLASHVAASLDQGHCKVMSWQHLKRRLYGRRPVGGLASFAAARAVWIYAESTGDRRASRRARRAVDRYSRLKEILTYVTEVDKRLKAIREGQELYSAGLWELPALPGHDGDDPGGEDGGSTGSAESQTTNTEGDDGPDGSGTVASSQQSIKSTRASGTSTTSQTAGTVYSQGAQRPTLYATGPDGEKTKPLSRPPENALNKGDPGAAREEKSSAEMPTTDRKSGPKP